jgi:hypothetical protein
LDRSVLQKEHRQVAWRPPLPSLCRTRPALLFEQGVKLGAFRKPLPIAGEPKPRLAINHSSASRRYLDGGGPVFPFAACDQHRIADRRASRPEITSSRFGFNRRGKAVSAQQRREVCRFLSLCTGHDTGVIIWPLPGRTQAAEWSLPSKDVGILVRKSGVLRMRKTIATVALALALMSSAAMAAMAGERAGDAALGAVSGALVLGPIGAVGGAVVGYAAGPSISHSWGLHRSSSPRLARRARPDARVPAGDSQPVPNQSAPKDEAAPQAVAPATPSTTTASTAPPVQPLE